MAKEMHPKVTGHMGGDRDVEIQKHIRDRMEGKNFRALSMVCQSFLNKAI